MTENKKHSVLSPSGAVRWLNCTPSARLEEKFEDTTSVYAEEGTLAHSFGELLLRKYNKEITRSEYEKAIAELKKHELYAVEMDLEVGKYTNFVLAQFKAAKKKTKDAILLIEQKTDLSDYIKEGFGTCDAIIIADGAMEVIDLKYGKGIAVEAEKNPQLELYGLGALSAYDFMYDIHTVKLTIVQPRLNHNSTTKVKAKDLYSWGQKMAKPQAEKAFKGEGTQYAGSWCKWCKAAAKCATLASQNLKVAKHNFKDVHLLTDKQLLEVYKQQPQILDWVNKVAEYLLKEALGGKDWKGYKLVEGRSIRKWKNEDKVVAMLYQDNWSMDDIFQNKLLGITAIEKLLGKDKFSEILNGLVIKPQGKPTLVKESDKRPALGIEQAKEVFK